MTFKIRTKILLVFVLLVLISSSISIGIASFAIQKNLTNDLINRIVVNTKSQIADLTNFVLIGDTEGIVNQIYNQKASHKDLAYLLVLDENNKLIASTLINQSPDTIIKDNILPAGKNEQVILVDEADGRQVYDIALRLDYNKGTLIAGYVKNQIDQSVFSVVYLLLSGAAFSIIAALLLALLFTRTLFKPLNSLKDTVRKITNGDLSIRSNIKAKDEIGELARAFNSMTEKLQISYSGLEEKVKARTAELAEVNTQLAARAKEVQAALEKVSMFAAESDKERTLDELMLASIGDAVLVTDNSRRVTVVNRAAEKLLSIAAPEMLGTDISALVKFIKKDATESDVTVWDRAQAGTEPVSLQIDMSVKDAKGILVPVTALISPIINKQGEHSGIIVTIRDIREQRQLEETRISFISVASHQLRTPLTSMRWFSEMLLGGDAGPINDEQKHFVERIYQGTDRMINLVSLLLQIARVEAQRLKVEPKSTDLKQMTKGVELSLKVSLDAKKQVILVSSEPENFPQIMIDQDIVWQVIQNLLSNANRYSPEKATINVQIVEKGDWVEYAVVDKGIGIPDAEKAKIFEKFYRAENALRYVPEGSGLGLSLVRSIVEGWGGKISFESKEGLGTTFTFTIPRRGMEKREGDVSIAI